MKKITIWTLDDAYKLVSGGYGNKTPKEVQAELCSRFRHKIRFGNRKIYGNQLMPAQEYFVPIVPKCIGNLFDTSENETRKHLDSIKKFYAKKGQDDYKSFWDTTQTRKRDYFMQTENYEGYYSILEKTAPNILIGYSQGGLTARYLNWLDKNVFKKNVIAATITVSSPNFGSPLANSKNKKGISKGILKIILVLMGFNPNGIMSWLLFKVIGIKKILQGIDDLKKAIELPEHKKSLNSAERRKRKNFMNTFEQFNCWLGGLKNDPNNAFFDLNIFRMKIKSAPDNGDHSVLSSINSNFHKSENCYGIISANMKSELILYQALTGVIETGIKNFMKKHPVIRILSKLAGFDPSKIEGIISSEKCALIDEIYSKTVMRDRKGRNIITNSLVKKIISWHEKGMVSPFLKPYAHDFIIPSTYQITFDHSSGIFSENIINPYSNHLSGSDLKYSAGKINRKKILSCLEEIIKNKTQLQKSGKTVSPTRKKRVFIKATAKTRPSKRFSSSARPLKKSGS